MNSEGDGAGDAGSVGDADARDAAGSSSDAYTHDPSAFNADGERVEDGAESGDAADRPHPDDADREFDWRGWTLVGVIFFSFVVAPIVTYLRPPQLPYIPTLIVFPLLPALFLGVVAVWATTRP
ncbi:hypothetical protein ACFQDG_10140 [Natronoarchaeum mannanilyticum]|uniref:Cox cluster protein n=1 Tax=Natronoarchaeum mannanilyticum TaxID=926360 RepID=A0AAV3T9I3_9EURY